jgi:hypothetical protein
LSHQKRQKLENMNDTYQCQVGDFFVSQDDKITMIIPFPRHQIHGFNCDKCNTTGKIHKEVCSFVLVVFCENPQCPQKSWHVCTACALFKNSGRFSIQGQLSRHNKTSKHQKALGWLTPLVPAAPVVDPHVARERKRSMDREREISLQMEHYFPREGGGNEFFRHEIGKGQSGIQLLVAKANFEDCFGINDRLDPNEAEMDFLGCYKYWSLSRGQQQKFIVHDRKLYLNGRQHEKEDLLKALLGNTTHRRLTPPKDYNQLRRRYFRGKRAIVNNLPVPPVKNHIKNHACLDPEDFIRNILAQGIPVEIIDPMRKPVALTGGAYSWITETPRDDELRQLASDVLHRMTLDGLALAMLYFLFLCMSNGNVPRKARISSRFSL